jgi:hypothetical protein
MLVELNMSIIEIALRSTLQLQGTHLQICIHYAIALILAASFNWSTTPVATSFPFRIHRMGTSTTQYSRHWNCTTLIIATNGNIHNKFKVTMVWGKWTHGLQPNEHNDCNEGRWCDCLSQQWWSSQQSREDPRNRGAGAGPRYVQWRGCSSWRCRRGMPRSGDVGRWRGCSSQQILSRSRPQKAGRTTDGDPRSSRADPIEGSTEKACAHIAPRAHANLRIKS